ncbi:hypothetical protein VP249E411_P0237 [Vibrio phage 249E41-1]|nr:hypothetical protein VP249E411_P0237 [Vibrio phage 249E41-1]
MFNRSENYQAIHKAQSKTIVKVKTKKKYNNGAGSNLKIPSFDVFTEESYPSVIKHSLFKEYYGKVTSIETFNTLRGWVVEIRGYHDSLFGRKEFSVFEEDCFAGGDPYTAYFKTEEKALERKNKIMKLKTFVL